MALRAFSPFGPPCEETGDVPGTEFVPLASLEWLAGGTNLLHGGALGSRYWVGWWSAVRPGVGRFGGVRPSATTPLTPLLVVADSLGGMAVGHQTRVDGGGTVPRFYPDTRFEASKTHV